MILVWNEGGKIIIIIVNFACLNEKILFKIAAMLFKCDAWNELWNRVCKYVCVNVVKSFLYVCFVTECLYKYDEICNRSAK